jgi:hypothetical protein
MDDPVDELELDGARRTLVAAAKQEDDTVDIDGKERQSFFCLSWRWTVTSTGAHPSILSQGCSYTKRELGWEPRYSSWRQGFAQGLG